MASMEQTSNPVSGAFFQVFIDAWKEIDLDKRRFEIDKQALSMYEQEQESAKTRQALGAALKAIKKAQGEERQKKVQALIKQFQKEVDSLTNRSKYAEKAFHTLYSCLYEAPDPLPALQNGKMLLEKSQRLEFEAKSSKKQIEQYEDEFKSLKNQEVSIRRLEEEKKELQDQMESSSVQVKENLEEKFKSQREEMIEIFNEREKELLAQLKSKTKAYDESIRSYEKVQSTLFSLKNREAGDEAAKDDEYNLLIEDLERTRNECATLRGEKEELLSRINSIQSKSVVSDVQSIETVHELEQKVLSCDKTILKLRNTIQELEESHSKVLSSQINRSQSLEASLQESTELVKSLQERIASLPVQEELDSLKRKIHALQAIQFNEIDGSDEEGDESDDHSELERTLLKKNRRLESEIARLKLNISENEEEIRRLEDSLSNSTSELEECHGLIKTLEDDLSVYSNQSVFTPRPAQNDTDSAEQSRFEIIVGQRDRYRQRLLDLESEKDQLEASIESYRKEQNHLKTDNLKLYEKLKYVQNYRHQQSISGGRSSFTDLESGNSDQTVRKYEQLYNQGTNPFADFNRKQKQQSMKNMSTTEKITLSTARVCLGSRTLRSVLFFYALCLHLLVFLTLWYHTISTHC